VTPSLRDQVVRLAVGSLLGGLTLAGAGSAGILYLTAREGLDQALLAAAQSEAHPWAEERWKLEHAHTIVEVRPWTVDDPEVPTAVASRARAEGRPQWLNTGGQRLLVLPVEPPRGEDGTARQNQLLVASATEVTFVGSAGPFLLGYLMVGTLIAGLLSAGLAVALSRAFRPLLLAASEVDAIRNLEASRRVGVEGPDEVRRLVQATNDLLDRLDRASQAQHRFTADAAHELRTPVAALLGELELALRQDRTAEEYKASVHRARSSALRMADLVEALLTLAQVEAGQAAHDRRRIALREVVHEAVQAELRGLTDAGVELELRADAEPVVEVQPALMTTAIANLLRNAALYAPGAPVVVHMLIEGPLAVVHVMDHGPGLTAEELERVFERFERTDRRKPGLGLGLPLAREIARRHGGDLTLHPRTPGLCATLRVPSAR